MDDSSSIKRDLYDCLDALRQPDAGMIDPYALVVQHGLIKDGEGVVSSEMRAQLEQIWDTQEASFLDKGYSKAEWALADQAFHDYCDAFVMLRAVRERVKASMSDAPMVERVGERSINPFELVDRMEKVMTSLVTRGMVRRIDAFDLPCGETNLDKLRFVGQVIRHSLDAYQSLGASVPPVYPTKEQAITPAHLLQLIENKPTEYDDMLKETIGREPVSSRSR